MLTTTDTSGGKASMDLVRLCFIKCGRGIVVTDPSESLTAVERGTK